MVDDPKSSLGSRDMSWLDADRAPDQSVPLRRQYLQIKSRFPDTILLFRLGDFYETFDDDARVASTILDIVLTGREMGKGQRIPMAGIPHHAAESHIGRLIAAGYKVAVCEQVGTVTKGRGLVNRDVTKIITPGTVLDPHSLEASANNYVAAVVIDGDRFGIAAADISTGEFITTQGRAGDSDEVRMAAGRELLRIQPAEIVMPAKLASETSSWLPPNTTCSRTEDWRWRYDRTEESLLNHFAVQSLDGYGCSSQPLAVAAAGGLLQYLQETQRNNLSQIGELVTYSLDGFMTLDPQTRRNLELIESARGDRRHGLIAVLDRTCTPMGARLLRQWLGKPLLVVDEINLRLDSVQLFVEDGLLRSQVRRILATIGDIERLVGRTLAGIAGPRDLALLRASLGHLPEIRHALLDHPKLGIVPVCDDIVALLYEAMVEDPPATLGRVPAMRAGFVPELDCHRRRAQEARDWIANLERTEREGTGIKSLKVGYNRVFGYYIEISAAALANAEREVALNGSTNQRVPPDSYIPKQTLTNSTRYFTPQLKEFETIVLTAQETLAELEASAFRRLVMQVAAGGARMLGACQVVALIDAFCSLAEVAVERQYVRPQLDDSTSIEIQNGRHPTLEAIMAPGEFVPNDAYLESDDAQIVVLTGPNMAGKSSWLRQTALIVLLAQIGSFVPAERARIGLVDRIFTRIGAHDDIATGQSTFMVEMLETANILHHATPRSLVILDEIGRGTSTYDGLAIARSIVEYLHNSTRLGSRTLFATHYHELTELEGILPRVRTYRMDVLDDGERIVFLRHVVPGGADRSYGLHVAQLAGLPKGVVRRAQEILNDLEQAGRSDRERARRRRVMSRNVPAANDQLSFQLTFFNQGNPVIEKLKNLEIEALSPLEAITTLFELQRDVREN